MIVSVLIVVIVVLGLVYITINKKAYAPTSEDKKVGQGEKNINMQNTAQTEVKKGEEVKSVDGVKITIEKEGTGYRVVKSGDTIAVNYTGTFTDGKAFDSNVDPSFKHVEPFVFPVGAGRVIKGWDVGVVGMKLGEVRKLELAPEVAYGSSGQGSIPPNTALVFEVQLLGIKK